MVSVFFPRGDPSKRTDRRVDHLRGDGLHPRGQSRCALGRHGNGSGCAGDGDGALSCHRYAADGLVDPEDDDKDEDDERENEKEYNNHEK